MMSHISTWNLISNGNRFISKSEIFELLLSNLLCKGLGVAMTCLCFNVICYVLYDGLVVVNETAVSVRKAKVTVHPPGGFP
ncbi:MAG: hypothetical protein H6658_12365 [Ardenticatenaceae bacterium]|nr:hypothetical protein [Ardenticatenaceae bacterium]